jgi:fructose-specific phosphotransferase system IIC component
MEDDMERGLKQLGLCAKSLLSGRRFKGQANLQDSLEQAHSQCKIVLLGWLVVGWLVGWLVSWFIVWLVRCLVGLLVDWMVGWLIEWLVGWLVGWFVGWLISWLISWLVD